MENKAQVGTSPNPSDIIWKNIGSDAGGIYRRKLISFFLVFVALIPSINLY
jgi:hypothetical protein